MYHTDDEVTINTADDIALTIRESQVHEQAIYYHISRINGTDKVDGWLTVKEWEKFKRAVESKLY